MSDHVAQASGAGHSKGTSQTIATYRTDALGRRVEKAISGGASTRYLVDGQHVVEEYDGSDVWQARYTFEDGWDLPRTMDRADLADVDGDANATEVLRFHYAQNAMGSVSELSQPSGTIVEWTTYDVYGQPAIRDAQGGIVGQSSVGNPFLFTGREWDAESATYFYRARQYDPARGRFLQRDSLGYADGLSLMQYAGANPGTNTDPTGQLSLRPAGGGGEGASGGGGDPHQNDPLTEALKALLERMQEELRKQVGGHIGKKQECKNDWDWLDELWKSLAKVLDSMDAAFGELLAALLGPLLDELMDLLETFLGGEDLEKVLDALEKIGDGLEKGEDAILEQLKKLTGLSDDQVKVLGGILRWGSPWMGGARKAGKLLKLKAADRKKKRKEGKKSDGPGPGCFAAGTLVSTPSGTRAIEDLMAGECVWAFECEARTWGLARVVCTHVRAYSGIMIRVFAGGECIEVTPNHPMWIEPPGGLARPAAVAAHSLADRASATTPTGGWVLAGEVRAGATVRTRMGLCRIEGVERFSGDVLVYNLSIEGPQTYAVGLLGVVVHNKPPGCAEDGAEGGNRRARNGRARADLERDPDFRDYFHRKYKPDQKGGGPSKNPDLSDDDIGEAWEEWNRDGRPKRRRRRTVPGMRGPRGLPSLRGSPDAVTTGSSVGPNGRLAC